MEENGNLGNVTSEENPETDPVLTKMIEEYVKTFHQEELLTKEIVNIDYQCFSSFVTSLEEPVTEKSLTEIINNIKALKYTNGELEVRFYNLPERLSTTLNNLGSEDIGNLTNITGTIIAMDDIKTRIDTATFTCNGCMNKVTVKLTSSKIIFPTLCTECGSKGSFKIGTEEENTYKDVRQIILEETDTDKTHQNRIKIFLEGSLAHEVDINQEVNAVGIITREPTPIKNNDTSKVLVMKANNITPIKETKIELTETDKKELKEISKQENILDILTDSLAPNIILDKEIKQALLCYLVKGLAMKQVKRAEIHILFIADPSTAKSSIGNYITDFTTKYTLADGIASTGVGLIGAVVKEPLLNTNVLELGAFPKANKGHCIIDEFDKLAPEEENILLNAMETSYTNIHKAGVHKEGIETKVSLLALCNPKDGRYNPYESIKKQIDFNPALLSRFDLIFLLQDIPNSEKDTKIATAILSEEDNNTEKEEDTVIKIDKETLKKYIEYSRQIKPKLTNRAEQELIEIYKQIRSCSDNEENILSYDSRLFESLVRVSTAISKLKLSETITSTEVREAETLIEYCLKSLGQDHDNNNQIDIDRIRGNYDYSDRTNRNYILQSIEELSKETVDNGVKIRDLQTYVEEEYNINRNKFYDIINQLETHKDIYSKRTSGRGNPKVVYLINSN